MKNNHELPGRNDKSVKSRKILCIDLFNKDTIKTT